MMDRQLIEAKINFILDDCAKLKEFEHVSFEEFTKNDITHTLTERYIERIVNHAIEINEHLIAELAPPQTATPLTYRATFLALADIQIIPHEFASRIANSAGLRNILVHEYESLDVKKLYEAITHTLTQYPQYCKAILQFLNLPR